MKQTSEPKIKIQGTTSTPTSTPFSRMEYVRRMRMRLSYRAEIKWRENNPPPTNPPLLLTEGPQPLDWDAEVECDAIVESLVAKAHIGSDGQGYRWLLVYHG